MENNWDGKTERRQLFIAMEEKIQTLEGKLNTLDDRLGALKDNLTELDKQISNLNSTLNVQIPHLTQSIDAMSARISEHENNAIERNNEALTCRSLRKQNGEDINDLWKALSNKDKKQISWKIAIITIGFSAVVHLLMFSMLWGQLTNQVNRNTSDITILLNKK